MITYDFIQYYCIFIFADETSVTKGLDALVEKGSPPVRIGRCGFMISVDTQSIMFRFENEAGMSFICNHLKLN